MELKQIPEVEKKALDDILAQFELGNKSDAVKLRFMEVIIELTINGYAVKPYMAKYREYMRR